MNQDQFMCPDYYDPFMCPECGAPKHADAPCCNDCWRKKRIYGD